MPRYADDTTAILSNINSAQTLFRLLDDFKKLIRTKLKECGLDLSEKIKQNP